MKFNRYSNILRAIFLVVNVVYIFALLFLDLLLPPYGFISISNLLLPIVLLGQVIVFYNHKYFKIFGVITSVWCIYKLINNYVHPPLTFQELTEIFRLFKLFAIVFSVVYIQRYHQNIVRNFVEISFILQVLVVAFQLLGVDYFIDTYTIRPEQVVSLKYGLVDGRVSGVFLNPNDLGFFNILYALYFFFNKEINKIRSRYFLITLALSIVFISQSRTVFIALLATILMVSVYHYLKNKKIKFNLKPVLLILSLVVLFSLLLPNTRSLIDGSAFKSHSFLSRFEIIGNTIDVNKSSILIGQGYVVNISEMVGGAIDNEYAFVYLQYGLIGLVLLFISIFVALRVVRTFPNKLFFYATLLVFFIVGFTNLSFSNFEVIPYFAIVMVLIAKMHSNSLTTKE